MVRLCLGEAPEISEERLAEIAAIPDDAIDYGDIPDLSDDDEFWENDNFLRSLCSLRLIPLFSSSLRLGDFA